MTPPHTRTCEPTQRGVHGALSLGPAACLSSTAAVTSPPHWGFTRHRSRHRPCINSQTLVTPAVMEGTPLAQSGQPRQCDAHHWRGGCEARAGTRRAAGLQHLEAPRLAALRGGDARCAPRPVGEPASSCPRGLGPAQFGGVAEAGGPPAPREFQARVSARSASPPPRPPRPPRRAGFPRGRGRPPGLGRGRSPLRRLPVSAPRGVAAPPGRGGEGRHRRTLTAEVDAPGPGCRHMRRNSHHLGRGGGRVLPDIQVRPWGSVTIPQVMTHQLFLCKRLRELGAASGSWVRIPVVPRFSHLEYGNHSSTYLAEYCANKRHPGEPRLCPGWGPAWEPGRGPLRRAFARGPRTPACPAPPLCPPWLPRGLPRAPSGPPRPKSPRSPQARPGAALPAASTGPGALRPAAGRG